MTFIWPLMLLSLLLIPLCIYFYMRMQQRRRLITTRIGTLGIVRERSQKDGGRPLGRRRHLPPLLFLAGLTLLLTAMARPQATIQLPRMEGTVILAFDVSGSMSADDLKPNRMEAAKEAARTLVDRQPATVRIGVVAFSDSGLAVQPPTYEREKVLNAIERLRPELGTSLGQGILSSLNVLFATPETEKQPDEQNERYTNLTPTPAPTLTPAPVGSYKSGAIVLITDGENTAPPDPIEAAQVAADRGVRLYAVGVGDPAGATLTVNGFTVHTRLDEPTLQQLAAHTEGAYFNAKNAEELRSIYENIDLEFVVKGDKMEVTALFAAASLLLLLIGAAFSMLWFSRIP